eukprot:1494791-Pyramimonas_sp.AAC.1
MLHPLGGVTNTYGHARPGNLSPVNVSGGCLERTVGFGNALEGRWSRGNIRTSPASSPSSLVVRTKIAAHIPSN